MSNELPQNFMEGDFEESVVFEKEEIIQVPSDEKENENEKDTTPSKSSLKQPAVQSQPFQEKTSNSPQVKRVKSYVS